VKCALISDIHSNVPALAVVLQEIARRDDVDAVCLLGDLVSYASWPN
jgi:predicted phosphodiesterase